MLPLSASFLFFLLAFSVATEAAQGNQLEVAVYYNSEGYIVKEGTPQDNNWVAHGVYFQEINMTGWGRLFISTNGGYPDLNQSYAAGYAEAALTADLMYMYWLNVKDYMLFDPEQPGIDQWLMSNDAWTRQMADENRAKSPFWDHVYSLLGQMDGLRDGYNAFRTPNITEPFSAVDFLRFQANCDLDDINDSLLPPSRRVNWKTLSVKEMRRRFHLSTHCSALIKVTEDLSNLIAGHTTWYYYSTMLRIYKVYELNLKNSETAATRVSFSSAPGTLSSGDDYYQMSSGLVSIETSLIVVNMSLYDFVIPQNLLYWVRVIVANRMADSGSSWSDLFVKYNSGTYNNQWMVVDYNQFTPHQPLKNNTLWVVEQFPKYTQAADQTSVLQFGYWPSYNVPFYPFLYEISGNADSAQDDPIDMDYQLAARAQIFRRNQTDARTLEDYQKVLRYNNWEEDPLSYNDPANAISSRYDLEPVDADFYGSLDGKCTDYYSNLNGQTTVQCGPTHDQQPVFTWPETSMPHYGQPGSFDFPWVTMSPKY